MDISAESISSISQLQFQAEMSTKVARKALDVLQAEGEQLVEMLESVPEAAPSPSTRTGLNIDTLA